MYQIPNGAIQKYATAILFQTENYPFIPDDITAVHFCKFFSEQSRIRFILMQVVAQTLSRHCVSILQWMYSALAREIVFPPESHVATEKLQPIREHQLLGHAQFAQPVHSAKNLRSLEQ